MNCYKCHDSGVIETGNNDLPCDCEAGDKAVFNEAGVGPVTGAEIKKHYYNSSPEPLEGVPNRGRALVVDDSDDNRAYVSKALREGGFEVIEAKDGKEGLSQFRYHEHTLNMKFVIVVSDWCMPNMMGSEMVRRIRHRNHEQKILMMSSDPNLVRKELMALHVTDVKVLYKAFSRAELVREVLNVMQGGNCEFAH